MRWHVEVSREAEKQLSKLPPDVRQRMERAVDEFEKKDDSQWSNVKALQGLDWKGRFRKRVGDYRIILGPGSIRAEVYSSVLYAALIKREILGRDRAREAGRCISCNVNPRDRTPVYCVQYGGASVILA